MYEVYSNQKKYPEALLVAQKLNDQEKIDKVMNSCDNEIIKKQLAFMLGRQRSIYETEDEEIEKIISYERLSEDFKNLARDLDVLNPKPPEAVFKSHLEERPNDESKQDLAKVNLSITYANAFINAAYGNDTLMLKEGEGENWIWENKDFGQAAASASVGMLLLWDIDEGFSTIDKYMESTNDLIRTGSYMALGLVNSGIKNEQDPVFALLSEKLEAASEHERIGALMGLSFTYAGSAREDILEVVGPMIYDGDNSIELASVAALVTGIIYIGSCNGDAADTIVQAIME